MIVIDDGSTDNTEKLVEKYKRNKNFKYIKKNHTNAPDTRNFAIEKAKNPWILWLDSDDILKKNIVDLYKNILDKDKKIDVLYGNMLVFGNTLKNSRKKWVFKDYYNDNQTLLSGLIQKNLIPNPAVIVRKSLYAKYGMYNTDFIRVHDYEFWSRVALDVNFKNCNKYVVRWRWHDKNMSSPSVYMNLKFEGMVLDSILKKYPLKQIFYDFDWSKKKKSTSKALLYIAKAYKRWGEYNKSLSYLIKSLITHPTNLAYIELLELYYFKLNKRSISEIPKLLLLKAKRNIDKNMGKSILEKYKIASILKKEGKFELSLERFLKISKRIKNKSKYNEILSGVYFHMGEIYLFKSNYKEAKNNLIKSVELNREHKVAKCQLNRVLRSEV